MAFRSSTGALDRFDDYDAPRRPERWDRDKFERMSRRVPDERETLRYEERDRIAPRRRDVAVEERIESRGPRGRFEERDRFIEDDHFDRRPGRRPDFLEREEPSPAEIASRALAPYRRKTVVERSFSPPPVRRPARPGMLRRQSSLDTFDRRPVPRFEEREREEWRPPAGVDIPLPIRRRSPSRRRRSPPRDRYREDDFEEIRYKDAEPDFREDYREVEIRREKSRVRKPRSERRSEHGDRRSEHGESKRQAPSSKSSSSSFEEIREVSPVQQPGKKGKTRMPKRLVHRNAIVQVGYPFEEEEDFLIVKRALEKPQIDEIIKISETYKNEEKDKRTTYRYEEEMKSQAPPPPPLEMYPPPPPPPMTSEPMIVVPPPPPSNYHGGHSVHGGPSHHGGHSVYDNHTSHGGQSIHGGQSVHGGRSVHGGQSVHGSRTVRSLSPPPRREIIEERIEESNHIGGPLTVVLPDRHGRSDREIQDEIARLENERRALQLERQARDLRISDTAYSEYEIIEERPPRNVVRVDKDRKVRAVSRSRARSRSRPPNPKLVAAMMSTLA